MTELERLDLASASPSDDRIEVLCAEFPDVCSETGIDVDALRRTLDDWVDPGQERFGLTWPGKAACMRVIQERSLGTLVPDIDQSVDFETTKHVIVEGENLEVLKLMQRAYHGEVKLIYIDPPYNTGKEFIYPDNFREGLTDYLRYSGQVDEQGFKLTANAESDGRYHSKWLSMMYPRLFLARSLLRDDGVIFVSIDDHEVHNLRHLMNEIFGEENFAAEICVVNNLKGRNDRENVATTHEYLLMYTREAFTTLGLPLTAKQRSEYRRISADGRPFQWRDLRKRGGADTRAQRPNLFFPVWIDPTDGSVSMEESEAHLIRVVPTKADGSDGCWRWGTRKVLAELEQLHASKVAGKDRWNVSYPVFLETEDGMRTATPKSVWTGPEYSTDRATKSFNALIPDFPGMTPKSVDLLRAIVDQSMDDGDVCLDFFAGSGTTAHAVYQALAESPRDLRFMLVQLPEPTDHDDLQSIAAVTRERVKRAGALISKADMPLRDGDPPDLGFRSFRLTASNFSVWDSSVVEPDELAEQLQLAISHRRAGTSDLAVLMELVIKTGYPLTAEVEETTFAGLDGFSVAGGSLLVCLSDALTVDAVEEMAARGPALILVLDAGFAGQDELKVNALQTIRTHNRRTGDDISLKVV